MFPDTIAALRGLQAQGVQRYLVSSTDAGTVAAYTRRHGLDVWLDGAQGLTPGRAKGDQLAAVLRATGLRSGEVVFVGDSRRDGDFSRAAGIPFLGVRRHLDAQAFHASGLESVLDLTALLPSFNGIRRQARASLSQDGGSGFGILLNFLPGLRTSWSRSRSGGSRKTTSQVAA